MARKVPTANDVFVDSLKNRVFARPATFPEAFPTVESIRVVGRQTGEGVGASEHDDGRVYITDVYDLRQFIDCKNPQCCVGGFQIGHLIDFMVQARETRKEFDILLCAGHEGTKTRKDAPCWNRLRDVVIDITYKSESRPRTEA